MNANDVYNIAKALSEDEIRKLYDMLYTDLRSNIKLQNPRIISQKEAIAYLLKTQFSKY